MGGWFWDRKEIFERLAVQINSTVTLDTGKESPTLSTKEGASIRFGVKNVRRSAVCFRRKGLCDRGLFSCPVVQAAFRLLGIVLLTLSMIEAQAEDLSFPLPERFHPIEIKAGAANHWRMGSYEVWILRGSCEIKQGPLTLQSREAVVWVDREPESSPDLANPTTPAAPSLAPDEGPILVPPTRNQNESAAPQGVSPGLFPPSARLTKVILYLEGRVQIASENADQPLRIQDKTWFGRLYTTADVNFRVAQQAGEPEPYPPIFARATARRNAATEGLTQSVLRPDGLFQDGSQGTTPEHSTRRIRVFPRGDVPIQAQWFPSPQGGQWIGVIDAGINLIVEEPGPWGAIDISADRVVIWYTGDEAPNLTGEQSTPPEWPLELYLEGNIVFRQGDRIIYADRMYYDVARRAGMILNAELLTRVPDYEGYLRLKADILQQMNETQFFAQNLFVTSSRLGVPGYRLQTQFAYVEDRIQPAVDPTTGQVMIDPQTGQPTVTHHPWVMARDNFVYLRNIPVFYWPVLAGDLTRPTYYLNRIRLRHDSIFGTQVLTNWDAFQLFGIRNRPEGTDWSLSLDYLSERGLGHGTSLTYSRDGFLGLPGYATGLADFWGIYDTGLDNLGRGRRALVPEADYRYRLLWQHRQYLSEEYQLTGELGLISDRNFLEQYYEREWDELKDQTTSLSLKRIYGNTSWDLSAGVRLNSFFTQTDWLPRFDHYKLGESFFNDAFTWYEHTSLGLARFRAASAPEDPADLAAFSYLPWETSSLTGDPLKTFSERMITRQEIDWPFQLGPIKVVPYALGELGHWGEDRAGDSLQRGYVQVGARANLPIWTVNPYIENELFNVHGIAHKVNFKAEALWANSNRDLDRLPLYEPLDDDSVEAFRRRLAVLTFGPTSGFGGPPAPYSFDERSYALRSGLASWVTSPSMEIADDLTLIRLGVEQRWQTKRGMPGSRRIVDWINFDTHFSLFPDSSRDDFGRFVGLLDYDARWFVGDRLTLASTGVFDFFDSGQKLVTFGGMLSRPPRGDLYVGLRILQGPIDSTVLFLSYSYWMSPKWMSTLGISIDLGESSNIGQSFSITRIGESFLVSAGLNVDGSRDSVGVHFSIEPRFLPKRRIEEVTGARIPVAGSRGLE